MTWGDAGKCVRCRTIIPGSKETHCTKCALRKLALTGVDVRVKKPRRKPTRTFADFKMSDS